MTAEERKGLIEDFLHVYRKCIQREGAEDLLQWLIAGGFMEDPASYKYHGAEPGGLLAHSLNVHRRLLYMKAYEESRSGQQCYNMETLAICGLLHDVCKMGSYRIKKAGNPPEYEYINNFPVGHGEKSVICILRFMQLTEEEIIAISWHMGGFDYRTKGGCRDMNTAFDTCKLAAMLHIADMQAMYLDEREDPEQ